MNLVECSCQPNETLEEHFQKLNREYVNGKGTLALIERLRDFPDDRTVYGLTSVDRLCLLSQDDYTTPWWVVITSHGIDDFRIECRLPQEQAPWRGAQILGKTKDLGKAVEMVVKMLETAAEYDTATGGFRATAQIFPQVMRVTAAGLSAVPQDELAACYERA